LVTMPAAGIRKRNEVASPAGDLDRSFDIWNDRFYDRYDRLR
jgi:hypothetical protein